MGMLVNSFRLTATSWTITIASGKVGSNLTDFPVYLNLADMPASFWAGVTSNGSNIRIKQSGSVIPFDVVKIDTGAHTGSLFFKAPTVNSGSSNAFTLDLTGGGLIAVGDPNGQYSVWTDYEVVYLMVGDFLDRKGDHALDQQAFSIPTFIDWECGGGIEISSIQSRYVENVLPGGTTFTLAATLTQTDFTSVNRIAVGIVPTVGNSAGRCAIGHHLVANNPWTNFDSSNSFLDDTVSHGSGVRARVVGTWSGTANKKTYVDGVNVNTDLVITAVGATADSLVIGGSGGSVGSGSSWLGRVGFVYLRYQALSADWLAAEASNLSAPSSFYSIT